MAPRAQPLRIAIDTGGTFTDCVWTEARTGRLRTLKVFSTPKNPSEAILDAIRQIAPAGAYILLHGTTVGTNALLERKGARTALVTTAGFEDAIEIGRQARPKLYDFFFKRVEPLVPKELRFGVHERTTAAGEVLETPKNSELESVRQKVAEAKADSVAVSLLFCFANPKNERALEDTLAGLGVPLSLSHRILPEFREYERTSTVVINAYLQPVMQAYLENLESGARRLPAFNRRLSEAVRRKPIPGPRKARARIFVMQSSGGITALSGAAREPVRTVLSGPAGGVLGALSSARAGGVQNIISFDMGGTSTDVSLLDGEIRTANDAHIAGFPISVPALDIHTVGAGGGSLARFDAAGALRVGPESAGADPGPICYGRGTQPTVTDANLLLGRLQSSHFLGGEFTLGLERTQRVTRQWLKRQGSTLSLEELAAGIIRVVNSSMEKAIRVVSIERGRDPRRYALVAFGGAGGLHACALAEELKIPRVIIPGHPGALSALGILSSNVVKDYSRTILWRVSEELPNTALQREFASLKEIAAANLRAEKWTGKPEYLMSLDLRYRGQGYELNLPLSKTALHDFEREHQRRYGHTHPGREIEIVTLRLRAVLKLPTARLVSTQNPRRSASPERTRVYFEGKRVLTSIYAREQLSINKKYYGPAVITEYSATTVVPPAKMFRLDRAGNLVILP